MDWDKLRVFHSVAEAGSFTRAGDTLNLSQSAVSRQVSGLEESLNVTLFHRHARGLILTEQGEMLFRTVREVFAKLAMAEAQLTESKERPKGQLKVTATIGLGSTWLAPRIGEFLEIYPDVSVDLLLDDRELDLSMREADVAIRLIPPRQPELVQRHLLAIRTHIYAATSYLKRNGMPKTLDDLDRHKLIVYGELVRPPTPEFNWLLTIGGRDGNARHPVLTVNNIYAILRATQSGFGLAGLAEFMAEETPGLVRVLPEIEGPRFDAYFVYPEELRNSKRIQVFRDFLLRKVAEAGM
ncbi:MAG: LysR family transcriptional regulator [Dongiaceae bacterium]